MPQQDNTNPGVQVYNILLVIVEIILFWVKATYNVVLSTVRLFVPSEPEDVSRDIVLITGAGHGMGKCLSLQYSALGTTVVCVDINEKSNSETVEEIKRNGGKAFGYVCDVTSRNQIIEVVQKIKTQVGVVTILVNNAGIMPTHSLLDHSEAEIRKTFEINVMAHFWLIQALLPDMIAKNRGRIVALSSVAGLVGFKNLVPYCGTKFAVRGMMEALDEELRADPRKPDIKFTSIYPYMVDTGLCKRPHTRFPELMKMVKPEVAAAAIIAAQRRGIDEASVPRYLLYLNTLLRNFPRKNGQLLADFLDTGLNSDL